MQGKSECDWMLFTLGCPGVKCASGVLWLENKRAQLSVMKWWNQARTQLLISPADFPVKHWSDGPSSLLFDWSMFWHGWSPLRQEDAAMVHMCTAYAGGRWQTGSRAQVLTAGEATWKLIAQPRWRSPPPCCVTSWDGSSVRWEHLLLHPLHSHEMLWKGKRESFVYLFLNSNYEVFEWRMQYITE